MEEEEEEGVAWEDALDVDDSDLPSVLRPCSQLSRPSQPLPNPTPRESRPPSPLPAEQEAAAGATAPPPPRRIPGPAGAVQAAMHRQAAAVQDRGDLLLEGEGDDWGDFGDGGEEVDEDFLQNPWLCALDFLGGSGDASLAHPIVSVKALGSTGRVPKLMGIVKSCKPNGLGDLFVTLKDPTGTIGASVHRRVLMEGNLGGDLSVGCVLILKQVAVFSPMRSVVYLNITLNNVDKLFAKDSAPPNRRILPTLAAKRPASGKNLVEGMEQEGRKYFLSEGSQRIAAVESQTGLPVASRTADGGNMGKQEYVQTCDREAVKSIHCKKTIDDRQVAHLSGFSMCTGDAAIKAVRYGDAPRASLVSQGADNIYDEAVIQNSKFKRRIDEGTTETPGRELGNRMDVASATTGPGRGMPGSPLNQDTDQIAVEQAGSSSNKEIDRGKDGGATESLLCKASRTCLSNSMLCVPPARVMEPKSMISKVSAAQWTDEQLSELFCDYQDDADFF